MFDGQYRSDEVLAHLVSLKARDRLDCAQDAVTQRMCAEMGGLGSLVRDRHRVVQVHPDLFDDHLLFGLEVVAAKSGPEDVGEYVECLRKIFRQTRDVVESVFLRSLSVVLGSHSVEVAIDRHGVAPLVYP